MKVQRTSRGQALLAALTAVAVAGPTSAGRAVELGMPVACTLGKTCFVQSYVDIDPSSRARDYRCGGSTYDGHKGTDFRLLSTRDVENNVAVLAAAPGTVKAVRDGMRDILVWGNVRVPTGRECGNGVVIDHGDGWETQYCHLQRGSVVVRRGQTVQRGDKLGHVGFSGKSQFAHLHLSVRKSGKVIDPFSAQQVGQPCTRDGSRGLWLAGSAASYSSGRLIGVGLIDRTIKTIHLERGLDPGSTFKASSPAIVLYARFINLVAGDRISLRLTGPTGLIARHTSPALDRQKAHYVGYTGKKRRASRWPAGIYHGHVALLRGGRTVQEAETKLVLE